MLTERQQRFVDAYRGNGAEAARAAGYNGTPGSLKVAASKLLRVPAVAQAIEDRQARQAVAPAADPPLAPKHRAFVDAFLRLGDASKAARAIKVSPDVGRRMLRRADVHEALELARARREELEVAKGRELQVLLTSIARNGKAEDKDRIRAISELHKIQRGVLPPGAAGAAESDARRPHIVLVRNARGPKRPSNG